MFREMFQQITILEFLVWLFILILLVGAIARLFKKPLFGVKVYKRVNEFLEWMGKTIGSLLSTTPKGATVIGFILAPVWLSIVCLNVLLLAQILEMWFPTEERGIILPLLGHYSIYPMIMGFLWAVIQTVLGMILEKTNSKHGKTGLVAVIIASIFLETYLAYCRALIFGNVEEIAYSTMWDSMMVKGGPVVASFVGFLVPLSEVLIGMFAYTQFIEPMFIPVLRWVGGIICLIWYIIVWWLYGTDLVFLPPSVTILIKKAKGLQKRRQQLELNIEDLNPFRMRLLEVVQEILNLNKEKETIKDKVEKLVTNWNESREQIKENIETATPFQLKKDIKLQIKEQRYAIDVAFYEINKECNVLQQKVGKLDKIIKNKIIKKMNIGTTQYDNIIKDKNELQQSSQTLFEKSTEIIRIIEEILSKTSNLPLSALKNELEKMPDDELHIAKNEIENLKIDDLVNRIEGINNNVLMLQIDILSKIDPSSVEIPFNEIKSSLIEINKEIVNFKSSMFNKMVREKDEINTDVIKNLKGKFNNLGGILEPINLLSLVYKSLSRNLQTLKDNISTMRGDINGKKNNIFQEVRELESARRKDEKSVWRHLVESVLPWYRR